jgi:CheY-like chemotaxis protein
VLESSANLLAVHMNWVFTGFTIVSISGNGKAGSRSGSRVIHVVDDEPMLLELAKAILEPQGYNVVGFRSGEAAFKAYSSSNPPPCLVITDFAMGAAGLMTGLDLIEACHQLNPRQKTLLLSGTVDESVCRDAPIKPDLFLAKPYRPPQLVKAVQSLAES